MRLHKRIPVGGDYWRILTKKKIIDSCRKEANKRRDFRKLSTFKVNHQKRILMNSRMLVTDIIKVVLRVNQF